MFNDNPLSRCLYLDICRVLKIAFIIKMHTYKSMRSLAIQYNSVTDDGVLWPNFPTPSLRLGFVGGGGELAQLIHSCERSGCKRK